MKTIPLAPASPLPPTAGLDISDKTVTIVELRADGTLDKTSTIRCSAPALNQWASAYMGRRVVLEVGTHSPWIARLLSRYPFEVFVANPRQTKLISKNRIKTDRIDAQLLARLGRVDPELLSPIQHRAEHLAVDLLTLRAREAAVRVRVRLINTVRSLVKSAGHRLPKCNSDAFYKLKDELPDALMPALWPLMECIECLTWDIKNYDKDIYALCEEKYPTAQLLQTVPGVGPVTALTYVLTLGDPNRFVSSRHVGSYLGLCPRLSQSGESDPQLSITKAGDATLRMLLVQCSHYILGVHGPDSDLRRWGLRLKDRGGSRSKKRAVVAVARKLAVLLHRMWSTDTTYAPFHASASA